MRTTNLRRQNQTTTHIPGNVLTEYRKRDTETRRHIEIAKMPSKS